jgi:hypothetical protein
VSTPGKASKAHEKVDLPVEDVPFQVVWDETAGLITDERKQAPKRSVDDEMTAYRLMVEAAASFMHPRLMDGA